MLKRPRRSLRQRLCDAEDCGEAESDCVEIKGIGLSCIWSSVMAVDSSLFFLSATLKTGG